MENDTLAKNTSVYERMRLRLILGIGLVYNLLIIFSVIVYVFNGSRGIVPNLIAAIIGIICWLIVYFTKKYKVIAIFAISANFFIISGSILFIPGLNYATPAWILVNSIIAYFLLKRWIGLMFAMLHVTVFVYYLKYYHADNLAKHYQDYATDVNSYIIQFLILFLLFCYTFYIFLSATEKSEKILMDTNLTLNKQLKLIDNQMSEREVMLKEIHHRVKNNLQIISSLLRLQSSELNKETQIPFEDAVNRIMAMALIHQQLYSEGDFVNVDIKKYIESLMDNLLRSYDVNRKVKYTLGINLKEISHDSLISLAIIINELVSNSLKHAFYEVEDPQIIINITPIDKQRFTVDYSDNGRWSNESKEGFGSSLLDAMTNQLEGTKTIFKEENGTRYIFHLKV